MATGFVQRFKGKIALAPGGLFIGGTQVTASGNDLNAVSGSGSIQALTTASTTTTLTPTGVTTINSSSAATVWRLSRPVPGGEKTIQFTAISSNAVVTASTDGSVLLNGSSINTTLKLGPLPVNIALVGNSTSGWTVESIYPTTAVTLSVTTSS